MVVYRIVKHKKRTSDISGTGAFNEGGRWNNPGTFALYTSENPALAMLEILVHVDESELPPNLFVLTVEIDPRAPILNFPDYELPTNWRHPENIELKEIGDRFFRENNFIGLRVRSAVMPNQYNIILNPQFPGFHNYIKITSAEPLAVDQRLINY